MVVLHWVMTLYIISVGNVYSHTDEDRLYNSYYECASAGQVVEAVSNHVPERTSVTYFTCDQVKEKAKTK